MTVVATKPQLETIESGLAGPRVVALGGGHGLACTLKAVKEYASEITAIVAVADDGGSSGRLTSGLGVPPPGDVRRCLLALAPEGSIWADLFAHRFSGGDIEDHSLGNLLLAALADITGDFATGVDVAGQILNIVGKVVPAAIEPAELRAVAGGREVVGQAAITKARNIETMSLGPDDLAPNPKAVEAIRAADQLILGPGSLYTSLDGCASRPRHRRGLAGIVGPQVLRPQPHRPGRRDAGDDRSRSCPSAGVDRRDRRPRGDHLS